MNRADKGDNSGVWTLGADGKGGKRRVTDLGGFISWSPDGRSLAHMIEDWQLDHGQRTLLC